MVQSMNDATYYYLLDYSTEGQRYVQVAMYHTYHIIFI